MSKKEPRFNSFDSINNAKFKIQPLFLPFPDRGYNNLDK